MAMALALAKEAGEQGDIPGGLRGGAGRDRNRNRPQLPGGPGRRHRPRRGRGHPGRLRRAGQLGGWRGAICT